MDHLLHTPKDFERIDNIAYHYYGDPALMGHILRANPHLFGRLTAMAGVPIKIPIIDPPEAKPTPGLPPWR